MCQTLPVRSVFPRRARTSRHALAARIPLLAVALSCLRLLPAAAENLLQVPAGGVQLTVPDGWAVLETVEGTGVTVGKPGAQDPRLDLLWWEPLAADVSASAAA